MGDRLATPPHTPDEAIHAAGASDGKSKVANVELGDAMSMEVTKDSEVVENGTIIEFGYDPVYRRVFKSFGNVCMVLSLTSSVHLRFPAPCRYI